MTQQYQQNEDSEQIRANIARTRREMSEKIDTIQDRLDPDNLKVQAKEAVYSAINDGADAFVGYVRDNSGGFSSSLRDAVKRNPIPAALVGLGLGWLLIDSMGNNEEQHLSRGQRRYSHPTI